MQDAVRTIEPLERREMLNGDWNGAEFSTRALFTGQDSQQSALSYLDSRFGEVSGGGTSAPEGGPGDIISVAEVEPNSSRVLSQFVDLGGNFGVNISGSNEAPDVDYFEFQLEAGAIFDARLSVSFAALLNDPLLVFENADTNTTLIGSTGIPTNPAGSPLTGSPDSQFGLADRAVHYIVPETGRYRIRVSDVGGAYNLLLRQYRPTFEAESFDTHQTLFLDFDGEFVDRSLFFPVPGSANLAPTRSFLPQYGIQDSDYEIFIDNIVGRVQAKFDQLAADTTNPNFKLTILNSKDHADPWGQPNVSRVIIGGTFQELIDDPTADSGLLGIAQSVDAGNFDREETALVLHDQFPLSGLPALDPGVTAMDAWSELFAVVIAHEAGHYFGGRHQDPNNNVFGIMDQFYDPTISSGAATDGIFGSDDDEPLTFNVDAFTAQGQFEPGFVNDTTNWLGWALTSGRGDAANVTGNIYIDNNQNRLFNSGVDTGVQAVVYADVNNNGLFDQATDIFTVSAADGSYNLDVPAGTHPIKVGTPAGFRLTTAATQVITVGAGGTVSGIDFGHEAATPEVTGTKFNDLNGNGLRDAGEEGIGGVFIYIDLDGDDRIDIGEPAAQTNPDGTYKLNFPGPGLYAVREVIDSGFVQTAPGAANNFEHIVELTGNPLIDSARMSGLDFGNVLTVDFGDAPATYGEARHGFVPGFTLGANWDAEPASQFTSDATGDDVNGLPGIGGVTVDDEDGVILSRPLVAGSTNNRVSVTTNNTAGLNGYISAWADFNGNGQFETTEQIITDQVMPAGANITTDVVFAAPAGAILQDTIVRFRYSGEIGVGPTGEIDTGEVEDYQFTVVDTLELAVNDSFSVSRNSNQNFLDVLGNDFRLPGEALEVLSASASTAGATIQVTTNGILYTPPNSFIGIDSFSYTMQNEAGEVDTATVTVNVNLFFEDPVAIDDSFDLATNSIAFPLNVLANDIEGQDGALSIVSVTQPARGEIDIATGGKSLLYTPERGFGGTDIFTYTVADSAQNRSTATVTLHTLPGDRADDIAEIRLVATDLSGTPITAIQQGDEFQIQMLVDDLRFDSSNPGTAAGVFAAYADILYNLQLVSTIPSTDPTDGFTFETDFFNDYINFQDGDATIPGIVDQYGAFSNRPAINEPNPVLLGTITFTAQSPGIARFMADPADDLPPAEGGGVLLFDTPGTGVPVEQIRYLGTSLEIFGDGVEFPIAVDDSLPNPIPANTARMPIDVLANDIPGSTNSIQLISSSAGINGTTSVDDRGTPTFSDDRILYTPNSGFNGADQFTYTIQDARGIQSTATVTLRVGSADADDIVALRLSVTDTNGNPVTQVTQGSEFQLRGFVQDLRGFGVDRGVFAAYEDVLYSSSLVSPVLSSTNVPDLGFEVEFGANYQRVREGDVRIPGVINEIGAVQVDNNNQPLGTGEELLFVVTMTANNLGTAEFIADPADISPLHDVLTFEPPEPVTFDKIRFGFDSVDIIAASGGSGSAQQNALNRFDVNDDGFVSPIDPLIVMNELNRAARGSGSATQGEGESPQYYPDINGDGIISAVDALQGLNYLNSLSGTGEGEGQATVFDLGKLPMTDLPVAGEEQAEESTIFIDATKSIGPRMTSQVYGPAAPGIDSVLDEADEDMDDVLSQIASDIDVEWNDQV